MRKNRVNPRLLVNVIELAHQYAQENDFGPYSKAVESILSAYRGGDFALGKELISSLCRPEFGSDYYFVRRQFGALLSKVPFPSNREARRELTLRNFFNVEDRCAAVNAKFTDPSASFTEVQLRVLYRARSEIVKILGGDLSDHAYRACIRMSYPGGGVSGGTHNRYRVSLPYKFLDTSPSGSRTACAHFERLLYECPDWSRYLRQKGETYSITECNRIAFVPKDASSERTIAVEPSCNVWLQLGVHKYLAYRLSRTGNGINYQSRNQRLAYYGSVTGNRCTIDLSSASDSLALEAFRFLIPPLWSAYLEDIRSSQYTVPGDDKVRTYHKYASMGNGTTFAIETIVFLGIARAVQAICGGFPPSAYGDDLIVEKNQALLLIEVLDSIGFKINIDKTFITGHFRESCGKDYYSGTLVTPTYVRNYSFRASDAYGLINSFASDHRSNTHRTRSYLLGKIKEQCEIILTLPSENTQTGVFTPLNHLINNKMVRWDRRLQTWRCRRLVFVPKTEALPTEVGYLFSLFTGQEAVGGLRTLGSYRVSWAL